MKNTAERMREIAESKGKNKPLKWFLEEIEIEANKGETSLYLMDFHINNNIKKILEEQGFKVEVGGRYNETNTVISW